MCELKSVRNLDGIHASSVQLQIGIDFRSLNKITSEFGENYLLLTSPFVSLTFASELKYINVNYTQVSTYMYYIVYFIRKIPFF